MQNSDGNLLDVAPGIREAVFEPSWWPEAMAGLTQRLAAGLDQFRAGIIMLDASLKVAWLNRAADAQARDPSGAILVRHGQLLCRDLGRQPELTLLLRKAGEAAAGRRLFAGGAVRLDREEGEPLAVHVSPLPPSGHAPTRATGRAGGAVRDHGHRGTTSVLVARSPMPALPAKSA